MDSSFAFPLLSFSSAATAASFFAVVIFSFPAARSSPSSLFNFASSLSFVCESFLTLFDLACSIFFFAASSAAWISVIGLVVVMFTDYLRGQFRVGLGKSQPFKESFCFGVVDKVSMRYGGALIFK